MCRIFHSIACFIAAIGAINWGLVAFWQFNLVEYLDGFIAGVALDKIIYAIVAIAGIYVLFSVFACYSCKV